MRYTYGMIPDTQPIVSNTLYSDVLPGAGYPFVDSAVSAPVVTSPVIPKEGMMHRLFGSLFGHPDDVKKVEVASLAGRVGEGHIETSSGSPLSPLPREENKTTPPIDQLPQISKTFSDILAIPDAQYKDSMLTSSMRADMLEYDKQHRSSMSTALSHIAPSYWKVESNVVSISGMLAKTYYTHTYPSYLDALRTRDSMSIHGKRDMSRYIYPEDDGAIQTVLKQKATQLKAEIRDMNEKGLTLDAELELQYKDVEDIRQKLATREERYFEMGYYTTIYDEDKEILNETCKKFEQKIAGLGIRIKPAIQRMDEGFTTNLPLCMDQLGIVRSAVTTSIGGSFPFVSQDLVSDTGILYGVNQHTGGLVIFDRFNSTLPNMNSVVLATSGAGKSFAVKLEVMRYLLNEIDVIVIDPENEYKGIVDKVGGTYINIATSSNQYINPFDIPPSIEDREYGPGDLLRGQILGLVGMINILVGGLTPELESVLDSALQMTYQLRGMTLTDTSYEGKTPPRMEELYAVLQSMQGAENLALRLSKYVTGSFANIFNNYTNVDINNTLTVFSIRDLEDALKTPAMYSVLNFIRAKVRSVKKKRMLVCDEAWIMLQHDSSAEFLFGLIKRARKYGLGITTISQDIEDFMRSKYGKPIISNSSMQLLLKQSTSSIKSLEQIIGLSEAEKTRLVACSIGEGLLFAGEHHVALKILASPIEKEFISTGVV